MNLSKNNLMYLFCVSSEHIPLPHVLCINEAKLKIATFFTSFSISLSRSNKISDSFKSFSFGYLTWYGNVINNPVAKKLVIFCVLISSRINSTEEADPTCGTKSQKKCLKNKEVKYWHTGIIIYRCKSYELYGFLWVTGSDFYGIV